VDFVNFKTHNYHRRHYRQQLYQLHQKLIEEGHILNKSRQRKAK